MKKEINLQNLKQSISKTNDFLKSKGHNIQYNTMLNAISLFLGYNNWNTLNGILKKEHSLSKELNNDLNFVKDHIYIYYSENNNVSEFIDNSIISSINDNFSDQKIIRYSNNNMLEKNNSNNNSYINFQPEKCDLKQLMVVTGRLMPDFILINDLKEFTIEILQFSLIGHTVIIGINKKYHNDFNNLKEKLQYELCIGIDDPDEQKNYLRLFEHFTKNMSII